MKPASTSFLSVFATMSLSVYVTTFARADTAQNAFVIVEGEGVVRLDGRNFAVMGGDANNETEVTIAPQPGWTLLTPSRVKVKAGTPVPFQVRSKSMEEIVEFRFELQGKSISDTVRYTFIAANCGRQPTIAELRDEEITFPNLVRCEWSVTAPESDFYNCLSWSIGEVNLVVLETAPKAIPRKGIVYNYNGKQIRIVVIDSLFGQQDTSLKYVSLEKLDAFYALFKYEPTSDSRDADIVYFRDGNDGYHAARRKECDCGAGKWVMFESKLGTSLRVEHLWPQLTGGSYGNAIRFYKKTIE